ncbi:MAG: hypothetical protein AAF512_10820 [Pseudomonadota bacterium]
MYYGWPSLCIGVKDLDASTRFYQALDMEVMPEASAKGVRTVLRAGNFRIGLFAGLFGGMNINFRGADVPAVHRVVSQALPDVTNQPEHYAPSEHNEADAAGCSWSLLDPDGNLVFFDTNENEQGETFKQARTAQILQDAEQELRKLGADEACLEALRTQVIERFC